MNIFTSSGVNHIKVVKITVNCYAVLYLKQGRLRIIVAKLFEIKSKFMMDKITKPWYESMNIWQTNMLLYSECSLVKKNLSWIGAEKFKFPTIPFLTAGRTNRWLYGWTDRWLYGWTDRWLKGGHWNNRVASLLKLKQFVK